jgi:hypothetical protein
MTINTNYEATKTSEVWIEAYTMGNHPDLRSFENFSGNFLKEVNNPSIKVESLISTLCTHPFSGIAVSSFMTIKHKGDDGDDVETIPVLTVIHHPFKDSPSPAFRKSDSLFGIIIDEANPKSEIQTIEFDDPRTTFLDWKKAKSTLTTEPEQQDAETSNTEKNTDEENKETENTDGIFTPTFLDFFDESFIEGNPKDDPYQPLNNATQIPPAILGEGESEPNQTKSKGGDGFPDPIYYPRKIIALTPAMIKTILDKRESNFDGIIDGIREYTWHKMKSIKKKESRKAYLVAIYRSLQAFWAHGQPERKNLSAIEKFIRSDTKKLAAITDDDWATEKAFNITEALATALGINKKNLSKDDNSTLDENFQAGQTVQILDKTVKLCTAVQDMTAKLMNQGATKESSTATFEESWAYKAVQLASSKSKTEPADKISVDLEEVRRHPEKTARDTIAQILNLRLKANFRIDKAMAANIRSFQIFQLDADMLANMTIFHCFPRPSFELRDIMTGEELDTRIKAKAISSSTVKSFFEQKLGIADTAVDFVDQMFNFWKFNRFMFGDGAWVTNQVQRLYETIRDMRNEIKSLQKVDDEYIARIASKINNDYHLFLTSCVNANEDIGRVNWRPLEECADEICLLLQKRAPLGFVLTEMIQSIIDQSRKDSKRKQEDANEKQTPTGFSPARNKQKKKHRNQKRNGPDDDDEDSDREVDPQSKNPKVNPDWKMSWREFRRVISPQVANCPKVNGKSVCAMYNIVGECYFGSRCNHSHDDLPKTVKTEMQKWINDCKEKANKKKNGGKKGGNKE